MSDLLAIAQSGVRTYSRALEAVADNVANAATPGHVRRTSSLAPAVIGGSASPLELSPRAGSGVRLVGIERAIDMLQVDTLRRADSQVAGLEATNRWASELEAALSGPNSVAQPMSDLFASLSDLANDPTNTAVREAFLASGDALADRFNASATELDELASNLRMEAEVETRTLTDLAVALAEINGQLRRAAEGSGSSVTLQDERDRTLSKIAAIVGIEVEIDERGQANVRIPDAGGPFLVSGLSASSARILPSAGGFELRIGPKGDDRPATMLSGVLAGLSEARTQLTQARTALDSLATRIVEDFNAAHKLGVDLNGNDGGPLFDMQSPMATAALANGGTAQVSVSIADGATVVPMTLSYDGSQWTLRRDDLAASVTGALPLSLDGHGVDAIGAARAGDVYTIAPKSGAAAMRLVSLTNAQLATAPRHVSEPAQENSGAGRIELRAEARSETPLNPPFRLTVMDDGTHQLTDGDGAIVGSALAGDWIVADGFTVRLTGPAAAGDSFRIEPTGAGSSANGNVSALLALRDKTGPAGTLAQQQDLMISKVAVQLASGRNRAIAATENRDQAAESLNNYSGVDLNTEASEMLRLQQAFQANARIIQMAREIFEALAAAAN